MKKIQVLLGLILAALTLVYGFVMLDNVNLTFRLLVGLVLGYALVRGAFGFAGSVNRAYRFGSTKLLRVLMFLFVISSIGTAVLLHTGAITNEKFWINPINFGLLIGGILFGMGMAMASCCASGVLTDLSSGSTRAAIVVLFAGIGVFVGLPIARGGHDWIEKSWFSSKSFSGKGVYLPDWFYGRFDGLLGAVLMVVLFALVIIYLALFIEQKIKAKGNFKGVESEEAYKLTIHDELPLNPISKKTYDVLLGNPWSLKVSATIISGAFLALLASTKVGWGISTVFGLWFGKLLLVFGVSESWMAEFTKYSDASAFVGVMQNPTSVQNIAIALGALIAVLTMGRFKPKFKVTGKEVAVFAVGGFLLGFGTRFSKGCNVGALYTPIASFSLSGWFFLVYMIIGGIIGNYLLKKVLK